MKGEDNLTNDSKKGDYVPFAQTAPGKKQSHAVAATAYVVKGAARDFHAPISQQAFSFSPVTAAQNGAFARLLSPPYDPDRLCRLAETSSILGACIDAMEVNVESFGTEFVPGVDATLFERLKDDKRREKQMEEEHSRVTWFFKHLHPKLPTIQLRRLMRRDYELTGNAYWEILRNPITHALSGVEHLSARRMRIGSLDQQPTPMIAKRRGPAAEIEESREQRRFRRYAQLAPNGAPAVWFKEFGDPRIMDARTGGRALVHRDARGRIRKIEPEQDPDFPFRLEPYRRGTMQLATEVLHFCLAASPLALPYGVPRWIGALTPLLGLRSAEETNLTYFDHKTVPPGMLLVSGGRLSDKSVERITTHIRDHIKGQDNFHSILVIEARKEAQGGLPGQGAPVLQWVKMTDAQRDDALFAQYELGSTDKIIGCFRFWRGFVGRTNEINFATARVARELSEEQVFAPEREAFDALINRTLLPELGVAHWLHKSKGPQLTTPRETAELLQHTREYLSIEEGRDIVSKVFGNQLEEIERPGMDQPLGLPPQQQQADKNPALDKKQ